MLIKLCLEGIGGGVHLRFVISMCYVGVCMGTKRVASGTPCGDIDLSQIRSCVGLLPNATKPSGLLSNQACPGITMTS